MTSIKDARAILVTAYRPRATRSRKNLKVSKWNKAWWVRMALQCLDASLKTHMPMQILKLWPYINSQGTGSLKASWDIKLFWDIKLWWSWCTKLGLATAYTYSRAYNVLYLTSMITLHWVCSWRWGLVRWAWLDQENQNHPSILSGRSPTSWLWN